MPANNQILFQINVGGNANKVVNDLNQSVSNATVKVKSLTKVFQNFGKVSIVINQFAGSLKDVVGGLEALGKPGIAMNKNLQELSAITGVTGQGLKEIGSMAKDVAKTFGTEASDSVEAFKLLLSQLSPDLGNTPEVMKKMGEDIAILSKTMGGDTVAAAEVLTTAMNQFGVSMDDPIQAEKEMARMMNVMAAAAKEGSAELPQIQQALKNAGMVAKTANVSFEETTAAIEVLDKAGRKGAEGGTALRNVLSVLGKGKYLPKDTLTDLQKAGVNIGVLTDKNRTLKERLEALRPVMENQALLTKTFGLGNAASAIALIQNTELLGDYTKAVTGTNTAVEQANIIMESYEEKQKKFQTWLEGIKIDMFEATGGLTMYATEIGSMLVPLAQLMPIFSATVKLTQGLSKGIMALPGLFKMASIGASTACKAISVAIGSIPIVGWIAIAIAAIAGLLAYFWNTSAKFRATVKGSWAYVVSITKEAWQVLKNIFAKIGEMIEAAVHLDFDGVKQAAKGFVDVFKDFGKQSAQAYNDAYNKEMEKSKKEAEQKQKQENKKAPAKKKTEIKGGTIDEIETNGAIGSQNNTNLGGGSLGSDSSNTNGKGNGVRSITTNIQNLISGDIVLNTTTIKEGAAEVKRLVIEALQEATNEVAMSY